MLKKKLVKKKIENIKNYLSEMKEIIKLDKDEILEDFRNLKTLERNFQLIVDEMIDINLHFIRELELHTPDDFQSSFIILAEQGKIIPYDFAQKIAPVVGLRNILVHRYEKVSKEYFIEQVKKEYKDFVKYLDIINQYLKKIK